jgi:hypothetical protein
MVTEECYLLGCDTVCLLLEPTFPRVERISYRGKTLAITSSLVLYTLMIEAICSSEKCLLTRATLVASQETAFFRVTALETSNLA